MPVEPCIAILSATFNNVRIIKRLINSLLEQTDQDFTWIVADGASVDGTCDILMHFQSKFQNLILDSRQDFGIYDALNRAILMSNCDYYIVAGADDYFLPNAVIDFKNAIRSTSADLVVANLMNKTTVKMRQRALLQFLYGHAAYVTGHAVSLAIKRDLHNNFGLYSKYFPIAADQLFILRAVNGGAVLSYHSFVAGYYDTKNGLSSSDVLGTLLEGYRVQLLTGQSLFIQTILIVMRIIKNCRRILRKSV